MNEADRNVPAGAGRSEPTVVTLSEAAALIRIGACRLFDVNTPVGRRRCRIPGSQPLHPGKYTASELPADRSAKLLFYCLEPACSAARTAARRAIGMGYTDVSYMPDGIRGWMEAGYETEGEDADGAIRR